MASHLLKNSVKPCNYLHNVELRLEVRDRSICSTENSILFILIAAVIEISAFYLTQGV
jgi:hypothetical protein